jgi:L-aminopeptidase/D-esterase-like protein
MLAGLLLHGTAIAEPRARDLGVAFAGTPGPLNAITDVPGVEVGHVTLIEGEGQRQVGRGPVRTGVTAVLPRGRAATSGVFAATSTLNGAGELAGAAWVAERGLLDGPILLTNTHSVGIVRDAAAAWMRRAGWTGSWFAPVVGETWDGPLNDIDGQHVRAEHAVAAIEGARPGPVAEGSVGAGTGTICARFKAGIGTASRRLPAGQGGYTVGVLVQCNYGLRSALRIVGVPVGQALTNDALPCLAGPWTSGARPEARPCGQSAAEAAPDAQEPGRDGSIVIVVATDAPLLPHQLARVARRPGLALGRMGSIASSGSGDFFVAFSTAPAPGDGPVGTVAMLADGRLNDVFAATVDATEEAIVNSLIAGREMTGADGYRVFALDHARLRALLRRQGPRAPAGARR